jgi:heptaprenyl diphosphate synthase
LESETKDPSPTLSRPRFADGFLLALLAVLTIFSPLLVPAGVEGDRLIVKTDSSVHEFSLKKNGEYTIEGSLGKAVLVVDDGKASLHNAPCPLKICEAMGPVSRSGEVIICIPNKIFIKVAGKEELDAIAGAFALASLERAVPNPFPMIRLGLGNIMVLVALVTLGISAGIWVALGRIALVALLWGGLFSPTAVLSATGGAVSVAVMVPLLKTRKFSLYGISLGGAYAHILGQLVVATLVYVRSYALLGMIPIMGTAAIVTGIVNAWLAGKLIARVPEKIRPTSNV